MMPRRGAAGSTKRAGNITALPGGGKLVRIDSRYAKSFVTPLGYAVVIWAPVKR